MTGQMGREDLLRQLEQLNISDKVLGAVSKVDRENFVPESLRRRAYDNTALPIGKGQTISQPYTVAFMIDLLGLEKGDKVLEIGSGSGYNAAVMSKLIGTDGSIFSVERIDYLVEYARKALLAENVENVEVIEGDGRDGYIKESPYDRIIVTAAAEKVPEKLLDQLKEGQVMVIPLNKNGYQEMTRIVKQDPLKITRHGEFRFVKLV